MSPPPQCQYSKAEKKYTSPWIPPTAAERGLTGRGDHDEPEAADMPTGEPPEPYEPLHIEATGNLFTPLWPGPKFTFLKLKEISTNPPDRYEWLHYQIIPAGILWIHIILTSATFPDQYKISINMARSDIHFYTGWTWTNQIPRQKYPFFTQTHARHLDPPSTQARLHVEFTDINCVQRCLGSAPK